MKEAGTDLIVFLNPILDNLARPSVLKKAMQALYEYHNDFGIRPEHHTFDRRYAEADGLRISEHQLAQQVLRSLG